MQGGKLVLKNCQMEKKTPPLQIRFGQKTKGKPNHSENQPGVPEGRSRRSLGDFGCNPLIKTGPKPVVAFVDKTLDFPTPCLALLGEFQGYSEPWGG